MGLLLLGMLTGCGAGYYGPDYSGQDWYGPGDDYYGADFYGGYWGPDGYVFGHHRHGGLDHDFGRRGSTSRNRS